MRFLPDSRGQSVQIGAVLLFGVLIILLSTWQAFVIPNQNEGIEFNHNQEVQQQMTELRTTVNSMPDAATTRSATVDLGLQYPSRTIFRNPPPVSGTLSTEGTTNPAINISIANAEAADTEPTGTGDFWNGTTRSYTTGTIEYQVRYNQYRTAPTTIYDQSVLYNRFEREQRELPLTDQTVLQNGRLTLVALNGSLSETQVQSTSVDFQPLSTQTETVGLQQSTTAPITIEFPTRLNESHWRELLPSRHTVTTVPGTFPDSQRSLLRIELDDSRETYQLRLAKVGVGTGATETGSAYIVGTENSDRNVTSGETAIFEIEARDEFNRPLSGVDVQGVLENADGDEVSQLNPVESRSQTGSDGRLSFSYNTGELELDPGQYRYTGNFSFGNDSVRQYVGLNLTVREPQPAESGSGGSSAYGIDWANPDPDGSFTGLNCEFNNGKDCTLNVSKAQETGEISAGEGVNLAAFTTPRAQQALVDFAFSDRTVGILKPSQTTTDSVGNATTTFLPRGNGTTQQFVTSGGSGDVLNFTVEDFDEGIVYRSTVTFAAANNNKINFVSEDGGVSEVNPKARVLGPLSNALDSDGVAEVPAVPNNQKLTLVERDGDEDVVGTPSGEKFKKGGSLMAVGSWKEGVPTSVYLVESDGKTIYRYTPGEEEFEEVVTTENGVSGVSGFADITGNDQKELIYAGDSSLRYITQDANTGTTVSGTKLFDNIGNNNGGLGLGRVADFNNDGKARIPVVDGSNNLKLIDADGNQQTIVSDDSSPKPLKSQVASVDWNGDGVLDLVYLADGNNGNELRVVTDPLGAATIQKIDTGNTKPNQRAGAT